MSLTERLFGLEDPALHFIRPWQRRRQTIDFPRPTFVAESLVACKKHWHIPFLRSKLPAVFSIRHIRWV